MTTQIRIRDQFCLPQLQGFSKNFDSSTGCKLRNRARHIVFGLGYSSKVSLSLPALLSMLYETCRITKITFIDLSVS